MKYSENNKPLVCMQTQSSCYRGTREMEIKGILWHSTGANNPWLSRYVQPDDYDPKREELIKLLGKNRYNNDWNHISIEAGLNCWIGKLADGTVTTVQTMPWNYRPWGCGSGSKGSCNSGWIQFEICEDGLTDKNYFNQVYKEACEITAYLCKKYNIDPHGTVDFNGVQVPTILCHQDSYKLKLGSNHGDVLHWFPKHGKSMADVRNDVAELLGKTPAASEEIYRIRKSWDNAASQKGAYKFLEKAKAACPEGYSVYNSKGQVIYTKKTTPTIASLSKNSKGIKVKQLQNLLNLLGYNCGSADGIFGSQTENAVKKFQEDQKITVDGIFGATSFSYLKTALKTTNINLCYSTVKNNKVVALQNILNDYGYSCGIIDGIYGQNTIKSVKAFQKARGLEADGITGPKTIGQFMEYLKL